MAKKPTDKTSGSNQKSKTSTAKPAEEFPVPNVEEFSKNMMQVATQSQALLQKFLASNASQTETGPVDPMNVGAAFVDFLGHFVASPTLIFEAQADLAKRYIELWQQTAKRMLGYDVAPLVSPEKNR